MQLGLSRPGTVHVALPYGSSFRVFVVFEGQGDHKNFVQKLASWGALVDAGMPRLAVR